MAKKANEFIHSGNVVPRLAAGVSNIQAPKYGVQGQPIRNPQGKPFNETQLGNPSQPLNWHIKGEKMPLQQVDSYGPNSDRMYSALQSQQGNRFNFPPTLIAPRKDNLWPVKVGPNPLKPKKI